MARYLGLDASTQSLSALIIDTDTHTIVGKQDVVFGEALPQYGSAKGFLPNADSTIRHADPLMWVDALDLLFSRLRQSGTDLSAIRAISGAGQQHGSVYLNAPISGISKSPDPLRDRIRPRLSRSTAPIWMDTSTSQECAEITNTMGGSGPVVKLSGSRSIERFTGPQIRKFWKSSPKDYERTVEIHLVSSFFASLLAGTSVPIDRGDGSGMNLLELASGDWNQQLLDATAPGLREKLKPPVTSTTIVGTLAEYFVDRYGFSPKTQIVAFTGDNPSSLVGMGASLPGTAVISLGTSDTVFAAMTIPRTDPQGFGHAFGNPAGGFMALACFINGSLAREEIAHRFGLSWDAFSSAILDKTQPGNRGNMLLPYFSPEITPRIPKAAPRWFGSEAFIAGHEPESAVRAVVEAQAMSMRIHSRWIGETFDSIRVTGGASRNQGILQVLADVFQATILPLKVSNSSALGAALRAAQAVEKQDFSKLSAGFCQPESSWAVAPNPQTQDIYQDQIMQFEKRLAEIV